MSELFKVYEGRTESLAENGEKLVTIDKGQEITGEEMGILGDLARGTRTLSGKEGYTFADISHQVGHYLKDVQDLYKDPDHNFSNDPIWKYYLTAATKHNLKNPTDLMPITVAETTAYITKTDFYSTAPLSSAITKENSSIVGGNDLVSSPEEKLLEPTVIVSEEYAEPVVNENLSEEQESVSNVVAEEEIVVLDEYMSDVFLPPEIQEELVSGDLYASEGISGTDAVGRNIDAGTSDAIEEVTDFNQMIDIANDRTGKTFVVELYMSEYCPSCEMSKPGFEHFAETNGRDDIHCLQLDVTQDGRIFPQTQAMDFYPHHGKDIEGLPENYHAGTVPKVLVIKNGQLTGLIDGGFGESKLKETVYA